VKAKHDDWLAASGPVAILLKEALEAVQGADGVIFPPTFAPFAKEDAPNYVIDETSDGRIAIVDTVGSQANRMEPIFKEAPYSALVPRATIKVGDREVNLLDAGHRAADALVRFSSKKKDLADAFREPADSGNATKLAKLAPTSLIFGVWDSRGTNVKIPRLVGSTVRAFGVERLTRAAQFFSAFEKEETDSFGQNQDFLSSQGLSDAPAGRTLGGVIARKGISREALLNLIALRGISGGTAEGTKSLQRYVLGLSLVALTAPFQSYLREGCLLVNAGGQKATQEVVLRDGSRRTFPLEGLDALRYAQAAAEDFGVGGDWEAVFENESVAAAAKAKAEKAEKAKAKKAK
jgi:CRISPR-associated protein Csb1